MGGQRAMDLNQSAVREAVVIQELASEGRRPIRILTLNGEHIGSRCRQPKRWGRGRRADSTEPSSTGPAEIEDPEMKTRVRLDADDAVFAHRLGANQGALLISLPANTEACVNSFVFSSRDALAFSRRVTMREL